MSNISTYQKAHWKCNDNAANTTVVDSLSLHNAIASANTSSIYNASGKINGCFITGSNKHFSIASHADFNFGTGNGSFSFWVKRSSSVPGEEVIIAKRAWVSGTEDGYAIGFTTNTNLRVHYYTDANYTVPSVGDGNWHHVVITFNYTNHTSKCYYDNNYIGSVSHTQANQSNSYNLRVGRSEYSATSLTWNGNIDDVRVFTAYELSTADISDLNSSGAGTESDFSDLTLDLSDSIVLSDDFQFQTNPDSQAIADSILLSDAWDLISTFEPLSIPESLTLSDEWITQINPDNQSISDSLSLSDDWSTLDTPKLQAISDSLTLSDSYSFFKIFNTLINTDLRWHELASNFIDTLLSWIIGKTINTDLRWLGTKTSTINTELRWLTNPYTIYEPINYGDIQIFINSVDVLLNNDVDIKSGNIVHTVGQKSQAIFTLARKHDDLNRTHDGLSSEITNQNPVQIYIDGHLEFNGYISSLNVHSETETVQITALMDEPSDNRHTVEIPLPSVNEKLHPYHCLVNAVQIDNPKEDTNVVIIGSNNKFWNGSSWVFYSTDALIFSTDVAAQAYIDGYNDVSVNQIFKSQAPTVTSSEKNAQYYKGVKVNLGKKIVQNIDRYRALEYIIDGKGEYASQIETGTFIPKPNYSYFWAVMAKNIRTGQNAGDYRYIGTSLGAIATDLWVLNGVVPMYQKVKPNTETELGYYYVGSAPYKEISCKNGQLIPADKWQDLDNGLYDVRDESYNFTDYAQVMANLEYQKLLNVAGSILPITSSNIDITLDAYYYYTVKLLTRINVTNTVINNTFKNNNGFPTSVKTITINLNTMKVALSTDNKLSQKELDEIDSRKPDETSTSYVVPKYQARIYSKFDLKNWRYVT